MKKRFVCFVLAAVMVFALLPGTVRADSSDLGLRKLESGESYTQMITSQSMVDMIKDMEGFRAEPYWDVSQWSIGYGSSCGTDKNNKPDLTVTEEEAEAMLMESLEENYGKTVNDYCESIGRQPSQNQFDALVDFTYNLGGSWTDGCWLTSWLEDPTTAMDFVNAIGRWGRVSSKANYSTCMRRVREALVFLRGEYYLAYGGNDFETELEVVSNHNLPHYKVVIFQAGEGEFDGLTDEIRYYAVGDEYGSFQTPTREGYTLSGWVVTAVNNSDVDEPYAITPGAMVENNLELTAVWTEDSGSETEPTETEPTEPEPTEPEPTEPEPTEPEPTEPEPTEPEPTEPEPTEPEPTEPEPTEPEPTEPEPTEPEPTEPEPSVPDVDVDVELPFRDVPEGVWYREPVEFVYQNGYMSGTGETTFSPKLSVTRGMMVMVLYRIAGSPEVSEEDCGYFSDTQGKYYTEAVGWAKANGIVSGMTETSFGPNNKITRQDAMTILYRYCVDYLGMDGSCSGDLSGFVDARRVSGYAQTPVSWAVDVGLMSGASSSEGLLLNPRGNLTRAEAATVIRALVLKILESV